MRIGGNYAKLHELKKYPYISGIQPEHAWVLVIIRYSAYSRSSG